MLRAFSYHQSRCRRLFMAFWFIARWRDPVSNPDAGKKGKFGDDVQKDATRWLSSRHKQTTTSHVRAACLVYGKRRRCGLLVLFLIIASTNGRWSGRHIWRWNKIVRSTLMANWWSSTKNFNDLSIAPNCRSNKGKIITNCNCQAKNACSAI